LPSLAPLIEFAQSLSPPPRIPPDHRAQLRAAFDSSGHLRSIWHEDKSCAAAAAACNSDVTAKLAKLLPSFTTISLSVVSEAPTLLAKVPQEIKASYTSPNGADPAKEQKQKVSLCVLHCHPIRRFASRLRVDVAAFAT
jgi:hypothetical protein